ncbi:Unknown protein sequence [Pseudomonas syringae pv. syringae]|nr:Unknown protein sequence [Pseudomonas syringae pv. syringae]
MQMLAELGGGEFHESEDVGAGEPAPDTYLAGTSTGDC